VGSILDAADSIEHGRKHICGLQSFLDTLDEQEQEQMEEVFRRALTITVGNGRYAYVRDVIAAAKDVDLDTQTISRHMNGLDKCRTF
jgi:hypothetical protein